MDTMVWIRKAVFITTVAIVILAHHGRTQANTTSSPETTTNDTTNNTATSTASTTVGHKFNKSQIPIMSTTTATTVNTVPIATKPKMINCFNYTCDNMTSTKNACNLTDKDKLNISETMTCSGSQCYIKKITTSTHYTYEAGCSTKCDADSTCCSKDYCNNNLGSGSTQVVSRISGLQVVMICLFMMLNFK